ncbi:unnamed protein product (macronuclear) [Paramecium tetraurelia]|uniref:C2 domain-containing protein n=1 Tax=Paramecium tetraurelia TaxID=5888 RepID=A0EG50_PARTE|nr:uncharacterized protein GSPATT00026614001 [Paramecium tetraurelia]CAK94291.1 unnamed protein product [Paramecium tetraurelia]|eukprot:XP_001461664.1 hypothetical protein (macronuclear) [Paramecium tetraurelia strain d4-2]
MNDQQNTDSQIQQKLELFISCRGLANMDLFSKSDPFVILQIQQNHNWFDFGKTEIINDNLNPNFTKTFIIDYFFECQQPLKFIVNDDDGDGKFDFIGSAETTLGCIAGSRDQMLIVDLKRGSKTTGSLIIKAEQVRSLNKKLSMQIIGDQFPNRSCIPWLSLCPFFRIYRQSQDANQNLLIYQSEHVKFCLDPKWRRLDITLQKLCNGNLDKQLKLEVWDYFTTGNPDLIGHTQFRVNEIIEKKKYQKQLLNRDNNQAGLITFNDVKIYEPPTFMDYLKSGTQINLISAIDFTGSNGSPNLSSSLHYIDNQTGRLNQYQQALLAVGEILLNYSYDKRVPMYGFGCKPNLKNFKSSSTSHCFPLNGNPQDPEVEGIEGIMQTYSNALKNVNFDGPTYFNPLLQEVIKIASLSKDMAKDSYYVLFILTDGEIHDMSQTIDSVVASSHLPFSIIIVGVGNANFKNMNILDDDEGNLKDSKGNQSFRDLVQFVPFNQFKDNPELLAKNVLQELPDQIVEYMQLVDQQPKLQQKQQDITYSEFKQTPTIGNFSELQISDEYIQQFNQQGREWNSQYENYKQSQDPYFNEKQQFK